MYLNNVPKIHPVAKIQATTILVMMVEKVMLMPREREITKSANDGSGGWNIGVYFAIGLELGGSEYPGPNGQFVWEICWFVINEMFRLLKSSAWLRICDPYGNVHVVVFYLIPNLDENPEYPALVFVAGLVTE